MCPKIAAKLEECRKQAAWCHIQWNGHFDYEVVQNLKTFVVKLQARTCTCRVWDLTGIPCMHAITCIMNRGERVEDYTVAYYRVDVYNQLYSAELPVLPSAKYWHDTGRGPINPPLKRKMPGRPKHKRKITAGEVKNGKVSKAGMKQRCKTCNNHGHNSKTCPQKDHAASQEVPNAQPTAASQKVPNAQPTAASQEVPNT